MQRRVLDFYKAELKVDILRSLIEQMVQKHSIYPLALTSDVHMYGDTDKEFEGLISYSNAAILTHYQHWLELTHPRHFDKLAVWTTYHKLMEMKANKNAQSRNLEVVALAQSNAESRSTEVAKPRLSISQITKERVAAD